MIFVAAANEPTIFLMLSEADLRSLREGHTKFVDRRQTGGMAFTKVIVSLSPSDTASLEMLRASGQSVPQLVNPEPLPGESACAGCGGLMATPSLFEGRCTVCWATEAKAARLARN